MIISGFPGVGKSYFANSFNSVQDSDSSLFDKDDFPNNYISHIRRLNDGKRLILVSSYEVVRDVLVANDISFNLVYPDRSLKFEYLDRRILVLNDLVLSYSANIAQQSF